MDGMRDDVLKWLATGQVGESSKAMAFCMIDIKGGESHPHDPSDFNRCLLMLDSLAPEAMMYFDKVKKLSPVWAKLIDRWDEVEKLFIEEVGPNWSLGDRAPKTYQLMKEIGC